MARARSWTVRRRFLDVGSFLSSPCSDLAAGSIQDCLKMMDHPVLRLTDPTHHPHLPGPPHQAPLQ